jgi:hypothetical protein
MHVAEPQAATFWASPTFDICLGVELVVVVPLPYWPEVLSPQHRIVLSAVRTHAWA